MRDFLASITVWGVLEALAVITGMFYVLLQVKKTRRMWRWMMISSVFNGVVFFHKGFYSMTLIQLYYIGMSVYGIYSWTKVVEHAVVQHGPEDRKLRTKIPVSKADPKKMAVAALVAAAAFFGMFILTKSTYRYVPGDIPSKPLWDALVAVLSMLATYYLSLSYIQTWYVWIMVNVLGVVMFLYPVFAGHPEQALPLVGLLYAYYLVTSVVGLINWRRRGVIVK